MSIVTLRMRVVCIACTLLPLCFVGRTQAQPAVEKQSRAVPASAMQQMDLGIACMKRGDAASATAYFKQTVALAPAFAEAYLNLGLAEQQMNDMQGAERSLQEAVTLKPKLRGAHLFLGIVQYKTSELSEAANNLTLETKIDASDAIAWMWLGIAELDLSKPENAAVALDKANAIDPGNADILFHRGQAHLRVSQDSLQQMQSLDPDSWRVHQVLAQADVAAGHDQDAIREYGIAIAQHPDIPVLHEELGDLLWKGGEQEKAEQAYLQELAVNPDNPYAAYKLGAMRVMQQKINDALPLLLGVTRSAPSMLEAWYYLADAQMQMGKSDDAILSLQHIIHGQADQDLLQMTYYRLSRIYRKLGQQDKFQAALAEFTRIKAAEDAQTQARTDAAMNRRTRLPVAPPPTE